MRRWNGEIEDLLHVLFHFRPFSRAYTAQDRHYVFNEQYELHYARKNNVDVGGVQKDDIFIFAIELVEPAPVMLVYPNTLIYYPGTYRDVFRAAQSHGWKP